MVSGVGSWIYRGPMLYLPSGFTIAVGPNWGITGELGGMLVLGSELGYGVTASVGPTWLPSGRGVDGWFVTPKLTFDLSHTPRGLFSPQFDSGGNHGPLDLGPNISRSFLAGVDVGYQFSTRVSLALVLGASAGYGYDYNGDAFGLVSPLMSTTGNGARTQGIVWSLNLSLLRVELAR
jgi:hypothetical protein